MRIGLCRGEADGMKAGKRQPGSSAVVGTGNERWQRTRIGEVVLAAVALMTVLVSNIRNGQNGFSVELTLDADAVLIAGGQLVVIYRETSYVRSVNRTARSRPGCKRYARIG